MEKDCHIVAKKTEIIIDFWRIYLCGDFFDKKVVFLIKDKNFIR